MLCCWFCGNVGHIAPSCYRRANVVEDIKFEILRGVDMNLNWRQKAEKSGDGESGLKPPSCREEYYTELRPQPLVKPQPKPRRPQPAIRTSIQQQQQQEQQLKQPQPSQPPPGKVTLTQRDTSKYSPSEIKEFDDRVLQLMSEYEYWKLEVTDKIMKKFKRDASKYVKRPKKEREEREERRIQREREIRDWPILVYETDDGTMNVMGKGSPYWKALPAAEKEELEERAQQYRDKDHTDLLLYSY